MKVEFYAGTKEKKDKYMCEVDLPCPPRVGETVSIHFGKTKHYGFVKGVLWSLRPTIGPDHQDQEQIVIVIVE